MSNIQEYKKKKKVKMTFEVIVDLDNVIDKETLKEEYNGDIHKVAQYLYEQEGIWWDEEMKLIKTKIFRS
jgi:hypothetical protein